MAHVTNKLAGYLEGGLPQESRESVERHLASCPHCRAALAEMKAAGRALTDAGRAVPAPSPDGALWARIRSEIEPSRPASDGREEWSVGLTRPARAPVSRAAMHEPSAEYSPVPPPPPSTRRWFGGWAFASGVAAAAFALVVVLATRPDTSPVPAAPRPGMVAKLPPSETPTPRNEAHMPRNETPSPSGKVQPPLDTPAAVPPVKTIEPRVRETGKVPPAAAPAPAVAPPAVVAPPRADHPADSHAPAATPAAPAPPAADRNADADHAGAPPPMALAAPAQRRAAEARAPRAAAAPPPMTERFQPEPAMGGRLENAQKAARSTGDGDATRLFGRAQSARALAKPAEATASYEAALDAGLSGTQARLAHIALADMAAQNKDDRAAVHHYRAALEIARDAPLLVRLGAAYERLHEQANAAAAYRQALDLAPHNAEAGAGLARVRKMGEGGS